MKWQQHTTDSLQLLLFARIFLLSLIFFCDLNFRDVVVLSFWHRFVCRFFFCFDSSTPATHFFAIFYSFRTTRTDGNHNKQLLIQYSPTRCHETHTKLIRNIPPPNWGEWRRVWPCGQVWCAEAIDLFMFNVDILAFGWSHVFMSFCVCKSAQLHRFQYSAMSKYLNKYIDPLKLLVTFPLPFSLSLSLSSQNAEWFVCTLNQPHMRAIHVWPFPGRTFHNIPPTKVCEYALFDAGRRDDRHLTFHLTNFFRLKFIFWTVRVRLMLAYLMSSSLDHQIKRFAVWVFGGLQTHSQSTTRAREQHAAQWITWRCLSSHDQLIDTHTQRVSCEVVGNNIRSLSNYILCMVLSLGFTWRVSRVWAIERALSVIDTLPNRHVP